MEERTEGGAVPCFRALSRRLFGEFADDADKCSVFIFQSLVVGSQVNQDLVGDKNQTLHHQQSQNRSSLTLIKIKTEGFELIQKSSYKEI